MTRLHVQQSLLSSRSAVASRGGQIRAGMANRELWTKAASFPGLDFPAGELVGRIQTTPHSSIYLYRMIATTRSIRCSVRRCNIDTFATNGDTVVATGATLTQELLHESRQLVTLSGFQRQNWGIRPGTEVTGKVRITTFLPY